MTHDKHHQLMASEDNHRGFLLTKMAKDVDERLQIVLWLKTPKGAVKLIIDDERAVFFVEQQVIDDAKTCLQENGVYPDEIKTLTLKTFNQQKVSAIYFTSLRQFYRGRDILHQHHIKCYEDDFRPDERFLMERFITADMIFSGTAIPSFSERKDKRNNNNASSITVSQHYHVFKQVKCKAIDKSYQYDIKLSYVSLDIECSMQGELYSIGLYTPQCQQVLMIATDEQVQRESLKTTDVDIVWLENESALLQRLLTWFIEHDPDLIIGWNVINFDFSLLQKRFDHYQFTFAIGRDGLAPRWRKNKNSEQQFIDISGRVVLDGIDLLKTATYNFASFSLDNVANELLGLRKKVQDIDNRVQEITDNFHHNKTALAEYNIEDCRLVALIFAESKLFDFAMLRAQLTGLAIDRVGGSVAAFTNLYLPKLHRAGYVAPNMGDGNQGFESPGGYVMDSIPGLYDNVLVLDFKSLYPSIIRSFNIDPLGLIEGLLTPDEAIPGFDGAYFSRDKHFLPDIITQLWQARDKAKQEKNAALSQAIKIIMNSFYGVLGSTGCRFFDPRLSGSITKRSHEILKTTKQWLSAKGYTVIYGDTDSIFVHAGTGKTTDECNAIGNVLQNDINQQWRATLREKFDIDSALEIEFETHFEKFLMPTIRGQEVGTKKRYAGLVKKGDETRLVFKGLESVRTDWTELAKEFQQGLYQRVFHNQPVSQYINTIVAQTLAGKHDDKLIYRKRLRRKLDLYIKNVPPHVRAARMADKINKTQGKPLKFQNKGWIEYVMTINGPQAKGYQNAPLDYQLYIDRQLQAVADAILPFIGSSFEDVTNLQMKLF